MDMTLLQNQIWALKIIEDLNGEKLVPEKFDLKPNDMEGMIEIIAYLAWDGLIESVPPGYKLTKKGLRILNKEPMDIPQVQERVVEQQKFPNPFIIGGNYNGPTQDRGRGGR